MEKDLKSQDCRLECLVFTVEEQELQMKTRQMFKQKQGDSRGDLQDGGGVRHGDHLPPHKYIRNTSICGTTPIEHLLNAGRRPQTSEKPCG